MGSSRPLGSSLGLLVALGLRLSLRTLLAEVPPGGDGGFALTEASAESGKIVQIYKLTDDRDGHGWFFSSSCCAGLWGVLYKQLLGGDFTGKQ